MPQLAGLYFKTAIVFFLIGILMGLQMAISGSHDAVAAHAHTNLLGWVTMGLFGAYFALNPAKAESRLAQLQCWIYTGGVAVMAPSLYLLYKGYPAFEQLAAISSLVVSAGAIMFAAIIFGREPASRVLPGSMPAE